MSKKLVVPMMVRRRGIVSATLSIRSKVDTRLPPEDYCVELDIQGPDGRPNRLIMRPEVALLLAQQIYRKSRRVIRSRGYV